MDHVVIIALVKAMKHSDHYIESEIMTRNTNETSTGIQIGQDIVEEYLE